MNDACGHCGNEICKHIKELLTGQTKQTKELQAAYDGAVAMNDSYAERIKRLEGALHHINEAQKLAHASKGQPTEEMAYTAALERIRLECEALRELEKSDES
jgi:hypothetical protein